MGLTRVEVYRRHCQSMAEKTEGTPDGRVWSMLANEASDYIERGGEDWDEDAVRDAALSDEQQMTL